MVFQRGMPSCGRARSGRSRRSNLAATAMRSVRNEIVGGVVHRVPEDLRKTLAGDSKALAAWNSLTPLARNEWICWVISVKKTETRDEHVERLRAQIKEGKAQALLLDRMRSSHRQANQSISAVHTQ